MNSNDQKVMEKVLIKRLIRKLISSKRTFFGHPLTFKQTFHWKLKCFQKMGSSQSSQGSESSTSKKYTASGNGNNFRVDDKKSAKANQVTILIQIYVHV